MKRTLFLALAAVIAALPARAAGADDELARALKLQGDARRGADAYVICQGCHRRDAAGRADGSYPRLAGQHASVLVKQLADIRSGRRGNPKMLPFADHQALSVEDLADIAAFLQQLPAPGAWGQGGGTDLAQGRALYERDCASCHGATGEGVAAKFIPRIAGQHYRYLQREVRMIRSGERRNAAPDMAKAIAGYSEDEIAAVADYASRLSR